MEKNPWLEALTLVAAPVLPPLALAIYAIPKIRRGAKIRHDQLKKLQEMRDPERSSSGLEPDGTNPERLP